MVRKELKSILSEQSSPTSSLSPGAQKALEQSKIAKQNKDVQKKRAAAKESMKGISVESVDPLFETLDLDENDIKTLQDILSYFEFRIKKSGPNSDEQRAFGPDVVALKKIIAKSNKNKPFFKEENDMRRFDEQSSWHRNQNGELADLYKTKYRVNFGQGQVSNTFPTKKEAEYEMTFIDEPGAFIQFKDLNTGEWFNIKHLREQRIEGDKRHSDEADFFDTSELEDYQDDLNNDYLGFDDDGDIGDSYQGTGESSWDDGYMHGSYRYVPEATNQYEFDEFDSYDEEEEKAEIERVGLARYEKNLDDLDRERMNNRKK